MQLFFVGIDLSCLSLDSYLWWRSIAWPSRIPTRVGGNVEDGRRRSLSSIWQPNRHNFTIDMMNRVASEDGWQGVCVGGIFLVCKF